MKKQPAADGLKKRVLLVWWQYMYASVLGAAVRQRAVSHAMSVWIGATDVSGVFSCAALALVELRSHKCLSWCCSHCAFGHISAVCPDRDCRTYAVHLLHKPSQLIDTDRHNLSDYGVSDSHWSLLQVVDCDILADCISPVPFPAAPCLDLQKLAAVALPALVCSRAAPDDCQAAAPRSWAYPTMDDPGELQSEAASETARDNVGGTASVNVSETMSKTMRQSEVASGTE